MKRRIEKAIQRRMARTNEDYTTAKLIVLQQERTNKTQFRTTVDSSSHANSHTHSTHR